MNTPELNVDQQLPVLSFNFDQLKAWALALTERYTDLLVTEDAIADVKRDMAEINKAKKAVDDARKAVVRQVTEPIKAFETQIKDVCAIFDAAYAGLADQVKVFEDGQREEKRSRVNSIIDDCKAELFGNYDYLHWPDLDIPIQDKWLNKSTSLKSVREDVLAIIQRHTAAEQQRIALEQARQDRLATIESHVKALNQQHGLKMPISRFMTVYLMDMSVSLEHAHRRIDDVFANEIELRHAEESARKTLASVSEQKAAPVEQTAPKVEQSASKLETRAMSIVMEYDVTKESQVKACLENLKTLCVSFGERYR